MNRSRLTLLVWSLLGVLALGACRLDVDVAVDMGDDGTGVVTVNAVADAELMERVPDLRDDLRLDDAIENGWVVKGPTENPDGSARIILTHDFSSAEELANVLNSVGPPLNNVGVARTVGELQTTNAIDADLVLPKGLETYADADLIEAAGGVPFELDSDAAAATNAMSFTLRVRLPGELQRAETGTDIGDGVIEWEAPLDGSTVEVRSETVQRSPDAGNSWAQPLADGAFVGLIAWSVFAVGLIVVVAVARRRRANRRRNALRHVKSGRESNDRVSSTR